jgi:hypothetical protein
VRSLTAPLHVAKDDSAKRHCADRHRPELPPRSAKIATQFDATTLGYAKTAAMSVLGV